MKRREFLQGGILLGSLALVPGDLLTGNEMPTKQTPCEPLMDVPIENVKPDNEPLEIRIGAGLIPLFMPKACEIMQEQFNRLRAEIKTETGIVLPMIRIRDSRQLDDLKYAFLMNGQGIGSGEIPHDHWAVSSVKSSNSKPIGMVKHVNGEKITYTTTTGQIVRPKYIVRNSPDAIEKVGESIVARLKLVIYVRVYSEEVRVMMLKAELREKLSKAQDVMAELLDKNMSPAPTVQK